MNKKILAIALLTIMLATTVPVFAQDIPTGVDVPAIPGNPPVIKAKWEEPDDADPGHSIPGTQINPPKTYEGTKTVTYWIVATDPIDGKLNVDKALIAVYHPDGTFKYQFPLTEVDTSTPSARASAAAIVQQAYDDGLVHLNTGYEINEVIDEIIENDAKVYTGSADLDYHQMCGFYTVHAYAIDKETIWSEVFENQFEYVCWAGIDLDFNKINFGSVVQSTPKWVYGDEIFDVAMPGPACKDGENPEPYCRRPTVRNIGNTPVYIEAEFSDMGFGQFMDGSWKVQFDSSLKHDAEIIFDPFVSTRLPDGGTEPEPYCEKNYAVLDLCDTEKISFSIHIIEALVKGGHSGYSTIEPVAMTYPWWPLGPCE